MNTFDRSPGTVGGEGLERENEREEENFEAEGMKITKRLLKIIIFSPVLLLK